MRRCAAGLCRAWSRARFFNRVWRDADAKVAPRFSRLLARRALGLIFDPAVVCRWPLALLSAYGRLAGYRRAPSGASRRVRAYASPRLT